MKIFISYGHDCTVFVQKLRIDLEAMGHDIWMDISRLYKGSEWRSEIADGITQCQASLIFLSKHSLRPESVCRDEISISLACNRRIIRPIIMEKGIEKSIPSILMERQLFDFSDWQERFQDDNWYKAVTAPLFEEISDMADSPFDDQMEMIRKALRPNILKNRLLRELEKPYCERKWLNERIDDWLNYNESKLLLLVGFPGSGKSNYCSHYNQFSPNAVSLILCEWNKSQVYDVGQIIRNVSYQIATNISAFRKRLLWILNSGTISLQSLTAEELFDVLITEPFLYEIDGEREPLLIILDGLDEMTYSGDNALARLIAEKAPRLPRFVHFALASRKDSTVLRYYSGAYIIELRPSDGNVRKDIWNYLTNQLESISENNTSPIPIEQIVDTCEGSFLLASLITSGIQQGGLQLADAKIPPDVNSIYYEWMSRLVTEEVFEEEYYRAFAILGTIDKPLTTTLLRESLGWNAQKLNVFIRRFQSFLIEERDYYKDKCLILFQDSFRSWLTDEDGVADYFTVAQEDGYELLGKGALSLWKNNKLPLAEVPNLRTYLSLADMKGALDELEQEDAYLNALINIAQDAVENLQQFVWAETILHQCEDLCKKRGNSSYSQYVRDVTIPLLRAVSFFDASDFVYARRVLEKALPEIISSGHSEDVMQSLYVLGTSCDLLGDRVKSVNYFSLLKQESEKVGNNYFRNRALVGLAWNGHFSDINRMNEMLEDLKMALENGESREKSLLYLVMARSLMTCGELDRALNLFSLALDDSDPSIWGYGHLAIRNQMLLIELLVACYDNEKFDLGIQYGLDIYSHLSGLGSIAECYCASWIANNYLANGMIDQAEEYLKRAESLNNEANGSSNSAWMKMHLMSIRGLLLAEKGDYEAAYQKHRMVARMATECADFWVLGDALFEMILLVLFRGTDSQNEVDALAAELETTAEKSGLPHLHFKCTLIQSFLSPHVGKKELKEISDIVLENSLAATEMVVCSDICRRIAIREKNTVLVDAMTEFIKKDIKDISEKNPDGNYGMRRRVRLIQDSLQNGFGENDYECEH